MSLHPVSTMRDQTKDDLARALVSTIWRLRDDLSLSIELAENRASGFGGGPKRLAEGAVALAHAIGTSLTPEYVHLLACVAAIDAAIAHLRLVEAQETVLHTADVLENDKRAALEHVKREHKRCCDALRLAKAEAHRALTRAVERYPNAYDRE